MLGAVELPGLFPVAHGRRCRRGRLRIHHARGGRKSAVAAYEDIFLSVLRHDHRPIRRGMDGDCALLKTRRTGITASSKTLCEMSHEETAMRFMIIVKATNDSEAGVMPEEKPTPPIATYHDELARAGALPDATGLQPSSKGWRTQYSGERRTFIDGPFTETKELIAGYTIIQVKSREEAIEWTRRFPNPAVVGRQGEIEVRHLFELEDYAPCASIERFREMDIVIRK